MHGFEVSWIFVDQLFEICPLPEDPRVLNIRAAMILLDKFVKRAVEQLYFLFCALVHFITPIHSIIYSRM